MEVYSVVYVFPKNLGGWLRVCGGRVGVWGGGLLKEALVIFDSDGW